MFHLHYVESNALGDAVEHQPIQHSTTARRMAREAASAAGVPVQISRMRADKLTGAYVVHPDGHVSRPLGAKAVSEREDCKAPAVCFCSPCRAARRK